MRVRFLNRIFSMRIGTHFHIEVESLGVEPTRLVVRMDGEAEALAFLRTGLRPGSELFVACLGNDVDHGNLLIEMNSHGRCALTAHEHRGFHVADLSKDQALSAIEFWLPSQERDPGIRWIEQ